MNGREKKMKEKKSVLSARLWRIILRIWIVNPHENGEEHENDFLGKKR